MIFFEQLEALLLSENPIGPSDIYFAQICPWEIVSIFLVLFFLQKKKKKTKKFPVQSLQLRILAHLGTYRIGTHRCDSIVTFLWMKKKKRVEKYSVSMLGIFIDARFTQPQITTSPWKYTTSVIFAIAHDGREEKKHNKIYTFCMIVFWIWKYRVWYQFLVRFDCKLFVYMFISPKYIRYFDFENLNPAKYFSLSLSLQSNRKNGINI